MEESKSQISEQLLPRILVIPLEAATDQEALEQMSQVLIERDIVEETYFSALWDRENHHPTGLAFERGGIALPHTDPAYVKEETLALGIPRTPVIFRGMGTPEESVAVDLILLLAIKKPENELSFLSTVIDIFQNSDNLENILEGRTSEDIRERFLTLLLKVMK